MKNFSLVFLTFSNFILLSVLISSKTFSKSTLIEPDAALEEQLKIYQLFLKGHSKSEIEEEVGHSIPETNHHQALDHILYLINTKKRKREDIVCSRADYLKAPNELDEFTKSARIIQGELDSMYFDYTDFSDPAIKSCEFCYADKDCLMQHNRWAQDSLTVQNQYTQFQEDYQKVFCGEMAYWAEQNARPPIVLPPTLEHKSSSELTLKVNRPKSNDFHFYYDFSLCQKKQTFCPVTEDNNSFIHPSCYAQDDAFSMEEVKEKVSWMNDFSNKILNSCPGFPISKPKLGKLMREQKQLFTCFEKDFKLNPETPNLLNLNIEEVIGSNIQEPIRQIEFKDGSTLTVPLTEFHKQRIALSEQFNEQNADKLIELISQEKTNLQSLSKDQVHGNYIKGLDAMQFRLKTGRRLDNRLPDFPYKPLESEIITMGDRIEAFPSDQATLKTLNSFLELKIAQIIAETGRVNKKNKQDINNVASVWAHDCLKAYFKSLDCDKSYPTTPECNICPKSLTPRDYENGKPTAMTKVYHQKQFYKGRKCVDYKKLIPEIRLSQEQQQKACSQDLKLPSKRFTNIRPNSCQ